MIQIHETAQMLRLSQDMGVKFIDGGMVLYEIHTYRPKRIVILTPEEVHALWEVYMDGRCPVCLAETPLNDVVCDKCLERAQSVRE